MKGTIESFDGADGLGWIRLEDGRRVRFGHSVCRKLVPAAGLRVVVSDVREERGALRAGAVKRAFGQGNPEKSMQRKSLDRFDFKRGGGGDGGVPAGFFVKWLIVNDLLSDAMKREAAERVAQVKSGALTGRAFISSVMDEKPCNVDLSDAGLRFWRHYYGGAWLPFLKSPLQKDLMRAANVDFDGIFSLEEGTPLEREVFERIDAAFQGWKR